MAPKDERLVREALEEIRRAPRSGDVQPLTGQATSFRRRAGSWRIFFDLYPERLLVEVTDIVRRTTTTYRRRR
jgi:mRNA-degrading endonuclease RelE of RelBE toxin-antitoxin system